MKHAERNWTGIQHEELRRKVDPKYNEFHDALSEAHYEKLPFSWGGVDYGVLSKEQFDELHGLLFHIRDIEFHEENMKQLEAVRIPEEEYNHIIDSEGKVIAKKHEEAAKRVAAFQEAGKELKIGPATSKIMKPEKVS